MIYLLLRLSVGVLAIFGGIAGLAASGKNWFEGHELLDFGWFLVFAFSFAADFAIDVAVKRKLVSAKQREESE